MKKVFITIAAMLFIIGCTIDTTTTKDQTNDFFNTTPIEETTNNDVQYITFRPNTKGTITYSTLDVVKTRTVELDGYTYRIFIIGNGNDDGSLYVINLTKEELEIKHLKSLH